MWDYRTLGRFKQARLGNKIIIFDDLVKERLIENSEEELHCWIAKKEKRDYLLLNNMIKDLPVRILKTQPYKEKTSLFHFVSDYAHVGFTPEKKYSFKELVNKFFDVEHSNKKHFLLLKLVAFASYITKVNARICSNIEFGKDSTFEVLNFLTNSVVVFDKPKTMAKLEYGVVNAVLMVNELVPKTSEEKYNINEFLLSIGSLKPVYQKTTRGSSAFKTRDFYNIENLSLIICYNTLNEIAENDKEHYFDMVFGNNIKERFIPFKFSGKLNIDQFIQENAYNLSVDNELLKIARTIEWYKRNYKKELKPFYVNLSKLQLSGRQKQSFTNIVNFINLYTGSEAEFKELVNELLDCHYAYKRMLNSSNLITDYNKEQKPDFNSLKEEPVTEQEEVEDTKTKPLDFVKAKGGEIGIDKFLNVYGEKELDYLIRNGDIYKKSSSVLKVLE